MSMKCRMAFWVLEMGCTDPVSLNLQKQNIKKMNPRVNPSEKMSSTQILLAQS